MTDAGGVLAMSVSVRDPKKGFGLVTFAVGSTPPAWAQALIKNPKAWSSAPSSSEPSTTPEAPEAPESPADPEVEDLIGTTEEPAPAPEVQTPEAPAANTADKPSLPPKRGAGSGKDAWVAYAQAWGVEFAADATRDDIIDAVEAAPSVPSE